MGSPNSALKIAYKIELWAHIKRFGRLWQEDDEYVAKFGKDVYIAYMEDLEGAIKCFKDLADQAELLAMCIGIGKPATG